ncbi:aldo/keto reductase [Bacteroides salyersiae]|uniref:aldo/keto reductase n=1 Tax=Bacteroides salyersiae TaxID=291644 RepID=UPI0018981C8C|nr:aldo/keto reductase [Bacteroides salyersiae]
MKSRSFLFSVLFLTGTILTGCGGGASDNGQTAQATDTLPAIPHVVLNNGMEMPQLGVGTFTLKETAAECVKHAIGLGYRLVDAAQGYDNEAEVWQGIEESGIDRNEVFITSKIAPDAMRSGKVRESLDRTIEAFGGTYVDLMLIHWPVAGKVEETWKIMEEYVDAGKIRAIGVSNFNPHHVDELLVYARIKPAVNQIEIHPYMTQQEVVGNTFAKGIQVEGWAPLGQGGAVLQDGTIGAIARKHGKSIAQVILRWNMQRGLIAIPRCDNADYTAENMDIFDFELSPVEMSVINGLNRNERTYEKNDPDNFPW